MEKLYANYGRKNKPCEAPGFTELEQVNPLASAGLDD
ncbi:hypothetical protein EMIT0P265_50132 [Pseudomonas zeae]